ncbi:glycoside hydrolase family 18 protein [Streptomyces sp. AC512_CC834]|uniref:glycoside hydrolase family 18 protein n=1 Tax=Streptomyces sp. AC512_CC834 TaxID=2823691 RepID=UPI0027E4F7F0|nr:glycoside hydrolase family 18 protein [Streptomyces sp. AC512_CC834]
MEDTEPRENEPAAADAEGTPPGPPTPDNESSTGGAGGNRDAEGEAEATAATGTGTGTRTRRIRRIRRTTITILLILLLPLLTAETALRVNYMGDPADGTYTRNRDAMWLGHAWVDGRKDDADLAAFARRVKASGIRDLYVHTGPMEHDGTLPESLYPKARWLIDAVHRELPGVRVQAFLGDVLATEGPDGMRLADADTRAAVVDSARQVLDVGYDGVHLDLEPLHSGDRDYLSLLDDVRAVTRPRDAQLSVAAHQIDPLPALHSVFGLFTKHPKWWSQEFFGQVARRVDQIAVMSYDTAQPLEGTYGGYVAQQTSLALEVTPPTTHLLMGLPFYYESNFDHWGHAETVAAAVRGVRLGLSRTDADRELFGVAPYIDFAATETNWKEYREGWVR